MIGLLLLYYGCAEPRSFLLAVSQEVNAGFPTEQSIKANFYPETVVYDKFKSTAPPA